MGLTDLQIVVPLYLSFAYCSLAPPSLPRIDQADNVVDTLIEFIDDTRAKEIMKYLMEVAGDNKVVIVTKTKPYTGEVKLLTQEDILVNKIIT